MVERFTISKTPEMAYAHRQQFKEFCQLEVETGGPDPHMALAGELSLGVMGAERAWRLACYIMPYQVAAATALWTAWPLEKVLRTPADEIVKWLLANWQGMAIRQERRVVKGPEKFGYEIDNTIGTTPQINTWRENWIEFFLVNRLEFQLKLLERRVGDTEIQTKGEKFMERYSSFFEGVEVVPALLHGDLWSGNTGVDEEGEPVIYDPAVYYGHHEADFGILLMFGGFSQEFHEAYRELIPMEPGFEERQLGYQLYHYLNHYNLFGSSYRPSCMSIISRFS